MLLIKIIWKRKFEQGEHAGDRRTRELAEIFWKLVLITQDRKQSKVANTKAHEPKGRQQASEKRNSKNQQDRKSKQRLQNSHTIDFFMNGVKDLITHRQ